MMHYNVNKMLYLRGVTKPMSFLKKYGLTRSTIYKILKNEFSAFKLAHLEKICIGLNCTPNDLIEWKPDSNSQNLPAEHALHRLQPKEIKDLRNVLIDIPIERLSEFISAVEEVKGKFKKEES